MPCNWLRDLSISELVSSFICAAAVPTEQAKLKSTKKVMVSGSTRWTLTAVGWCGGRVGARGQAQETPPASDSPSLFSTLHWTGQR